MEIIKGLSKIKKYRYPVVALGTFDGVHRGHQVIIKEAVKRAKQKNGTSMVVTFEPLPKQLFDISCQPLLLTSLDTKIKYFKILAPEILVILDFNTSLAQMTAKEFMEDVLVKKIGLKEIMVGENYRFGKNREGDVDFLKKNTGPYHFLLKCIPVLKIGKEIISSTHIRTLIKEGQIEKAQQFLGHPYKINGKVIGGERVGRVLAYPTANIQYNQGQILPLGVFIVWVKIGRKSYKGICNIGHRPTFREYHQINSLPRVEVHLLDFKKNIYNKKIEIILIKKIRSERKFADEQALKCQIKNDERLARRYLKSGNFSCKK